MSIVLDGDNLATTGVINSATAKNATGTAVDFTGVPAGAKRITVMFNGVSTNGTAGLQVQIGAGSVVTSGYTGSCQYSATPTSYSTGAIVANAVSAAAAHAGILNIASIGSNIWVFSGTLGLTASGSTAFVTGGCIALSGTLDRVRITTTNGTDTFDAGSINILYE